MPLSMVSALTRVGLDPWEEAGRLSSLSKREAVEQLARLIAELPGTPTGALPEAREIARGLVDQLPECNSEQTVPSARGAVARAFSGRPACPDNRSFWCFALLSPRLRWSASPCTVDFRSGSG